MKLRSKSLLFIAVGTLAFALIFAAATLYAFRSYSVTDLKLQSRMAAELVRLTITHEMGEGNPEHISPYLNRLHDIPGLKGEHVIPADSVIKQFDLDIDKRDPVNAIERKVLLSGEPAEEYREGKESVFHYTMPYVASQHGKSNCLSCHHAVEGEVIGAVSVEIDVSEQRSAAIRSVLGIGSLFLLFGMIMVFALRKLIHPVIEAAADLKGAVDKGKKGDFSVRLIKRSNDEIGEIAEQTNQFMHTLEESFGAIAKKVEALTGTYKNDGYNLLDRTIAVVDDLVGATQFKQSIENDRNLEELYARLCRTLNRQFGLQRFSLYEVSNSKNRMQLIAAHGLPDAADLWCDRRSPWTVMPVVPNARHSRSHPSMRMKPAVLSQATRFRPAIS